jgi:hypothetical protein
VAIKVEIGSIFPARRHFRKVHPVNANRLGNVLDFAMAKIIESLVNLSGHLLVYRARYAYATWFGQLLYPCRQVDVITINIASVVYDFTQVNANPEFQALIFSQFCISRRHLPLEVDGGINRRGDTFELCQNGIPRLMNFLAAMRCNHMGKQIEAGVEFSVSFLLIEAGKSTIAGDISIKDGGELVFHGSVSDARKMR